MSEEKEVMRLSLKRKIISVVLVDENGDEKGYELRELNGAERNTYLNKMTSRVKLDKQKDGERIRIKSFDGFQADLLTVSLYDESGETVSKEFVESLPSSTQEDLFHRAQELSRLGTKDEDEDLEKND